MEQKNGDVCALIEEQGYCYLKLFVAVKQMYPRLVLEDVAELLGRYPRVHRVFAALLEYVEHDLLVPCVYASMPGLLHVDETKRPQLLSELLSAYVFSTSVIGADPDMEYARAQRAKSFARTMQTAGLDVRTCLADAASIAVKQALVNKDDVIKDVLSLNVVQSNAAKLDIPYSLDAASFATLQLEYPEFNMKMSSKIYHSHAYAAAALLCQEELLLQRFHYRRDAPPPVGYQATIVDVGANYYRHAREDRGTVHCCSPIINLRDSARESSRAMSLANLVNQKRLSQKTAAKYQNQAGTLRRCYKLAQDCKVTAPYAMMVHSQYDMTIEQLGEILDAHNIVELRSVMNFSIQMVYESFGTVMPLGVNFRRDGEDIVYGFVGDSSLGYRHDFTNLLRTLTTSVIVTPSGRTYLCEMSSRGCAVFLNYVHCSVEPIDKTFTSTFALWESQAEGSVVLSTFSYDDSYFVDSLVNTAENPLIKLKRRFITVDRRFYDLLYTHCVRSGDKSFNLNEVFSAAATFNTRMSINGNDVRATNRVSSEVILDVVVCVYAMAYQDRWKAGKSLEIFVNSEKKKRARTRIGLTDVYEVARICLRDKHVFYSATSFWNNIVLWMREKRAASELDVQMLLSVRCVHVTELLNVTGEFEPNDVAALLRDPTVDSLEVKETKDHVLTATNVMYNRVVMPRPEAKRVVPGPAGFNTTSTKDSGSLYRSPSSSSVSSSSSVVVQNKKKKKALLTAFHAINTDNNDECRSLLSVARSNLGYECISELVLIKMPGDGHCVFHALAYIVQSDWRTVREFLYHNAPDHHEVSHLLDVTGRNEGWGHAEDVTLFSRLLQIRFCFHLVGENDVKFATDSYTDSSVGLGEELYHLQWEVSRDVGHVNLLWDRCNTRRGLPGHERESSDLESLDQILGDPINWAVSEISASLATSVSLSIQDMASSLDDRSDASLVTNPDPADELAVLRVRPKPKGVLWRDRFAQVIARRGKHDSLASLTSVKMYASRKLYEVDDVLAFVFEHGGRMGNVKFLSKSLGAYWDCYDSYPVYLDKVPDTTISAVYRTSADVAENNELPGVVVYRSKFTPDYDDSVFVCVNVILDKTEHDWRQELEMAVQRMDERVRYDYSDMSKFLRSGHTRSLIVKWQDAKRCDVHSYVTEDCAVCVYTRVTRKFSFETLRAFCTSLEAELRKPVAPLKSVEKQLPKAIAAAKKRLPRIVETDTLEVVDKRRGKVHCAVSDAVGTLAGAGKAFAAPGHHKLTQYDRVVQQKNYGVTGTGKIEFLASNGRSTTPMRGLVPQKEIKTRRVDYTPGNLVFQVRGSVRDVGCGTATETILVSEERVPSRKSSRSEFSTIGTQTDSPTQVEKDVPAVGPEKVPLQLTAPLKQEFQEVVSVTTGSVKSSGSDASQKSRGVVSRLMSAFSTEKEPQKDIATPAILKNLPQQVSSDRQVQRVWWVAFPYDCRIHVTMVTESGGRKELGQSFKDRYKLSGKSKDSSFYAKGFSPVVGDWSGFYRNYVKRDIEYHELVVVSTADVLTSLRALLNWLPKDVCRFSLDLTTDVDQIRLIELLKEIPRKLRLVESKGSNYSGVVDSISPYVPREVTPTVLTMPKLGPEQLGRVKDPPVLQGDTREVAYRNAMLEFKHLTNNADTFNALKYKQVLMQSKNLTSSDALEIVEKMKMNVYDNQTKSFLLPRFARKYSHGYVTAGYVKFDEKNRIFTTNERLILVGRSTEIMLNDMIAERMAKVQMSDVLLPLIDWTNGPPGCGKTTYIIENSTLPENLNAPCEDLILCMTTEGKLDVSEKLKKERKSVPPKVIDRDVRTVASVLVNGCNRQYRRVLMDEALMAHAGTIGFIVTYARASRVLLIGDVHQIPYVDREHMCNVLFSSPSLFADISKNLKRTYRCPVDVTYALHELYPGLHTTNSVLRSMRREMSGSALGKINKEAENTLFMTYLQSDKDALEKSKYGKGKGSRVLTVHESQGLTFDHVVCIRTTPKPLEIFSSLPYATVAVSRHRKSFVYFSDVDDAITAFIDRGARMDHASLNEWNQTAYARDMAKPAGATFFKDMPVLAPLQTTASEQLAKNLPENTHKVLIPLPQSSVSLALKRGYNIKVKPEECLSYLQQWYDDKMPGAAERFNKNVQDWMELEDTEVFLDRISIDPGVGVMREQKWSKLRPRLHTFMFPSKRPSQKESLLGAVKRNLNAPKLANENLDPDVIGNALYENFVRSAVPLRNWEIMYQYAVDTVGISSDLVERWLEKQPPKVRDMVNSDTPLHLRSYNRFTYMVKKDVKPQLEPSAIHKYPSVQTIAYNDKTVNAIFCPIFGVLFERLLAILDDKIMVMTGTSPQQFEQELNARLVGLDIDNVVTIEEDMSKYDKAQGRALRVFEDELWKMLGMDAELLSIWTSSHVQSVLKDRKNGVSFVTEYQRKSGDATTYSGNTLVILAVLLACYDIDDIALILVAGDDSYIFFKPGIAHLPDPSKKMADLFNLECKLLRNFRVPYFCSKFLLWVDNWMHVVPDPLKIVTKLGRLDMSNFKHVEEYRISCMDTMRALFNPLIAERLSIAVKERYKGEIDDISKLIAVLKTVVNDEELFANLFVHDPGTLLCHDPSSAKLG